MPQIMLPQRRGETGAFGGPLEATVERVHSLASRMVPAGQADTDILQRYMALFPLGLEYIHEQRSYTNRTCKAPFERVTPRDPLALVRRHLDRAEEFWIASRALFDGGEPVTDFLLFDVDSDGSTAATQDAWRRVVRIISGIGHAHAAPLVYSSPGGGYHVVYFLDQRVPLIELVDPAARKSQGLVHDVVRGLIGDRIEVFPQVRLAVRWPLGTRQYLVDLESGRPIEDLTLESLVEIAESHKSRGPRLSLEHLGTLARNSRPVPLVISHEQETPLVAGEPGAPVPVRASTLDQVVDLYRHGLQEPHSRHAAMYQIARCMLLHADRLAPFGYDASREAESQLAAWLSSKHNDLSGEYSANPDPDYWYSRSEQYVDAARRGRPFESKCGLSLLGHGDWNRILTLSSRADVKPFERYKTELVMTHWTWRAKYAVLKQGLLPDGDGTYAIQMTARVRRELPFCSRNDDEIRYRRRLIELGLFRIVRGGSKLARRAITYGGFAFDFSGPTTVDRFSPSDLRALHACLGPRDTISLHYCLHVSERFPTSVLQTRYGPEAYRDICDRLRAAYDLFEGVGPASSRQVA